MNMNGKIPIFLLIPFFIVFISSQSVTQQSNNDNKAQKFSDYRLIQYITGIGPGPRNIMKLDNNGDIVLACSSGKTKEQLHAAGIDFAESQIQLLESYRLLRNEEGVLRTTFPIIDADKAEILRKYTKAIAPKLSQNLRSDIRELIELLESIHRKNNTYSILFSYVIDGLIWARFKEKGLIKEREITAETPFWDGEIWAIYPPRSFSSGTNSISDQGIKLKINWSKHALHKMGPFVDWDNLERMFDDYIDNGKIEDENVKKLFAPYKIFDRSGLLTIPIIEEKKGNLLFDISFLISKKLGEQVINFIDLTELKEKFDLRDEKQTLIIVYHELMWDLMDDLEQMGLIHKPVAFTNPEKATPEDIADLIFIVKSYN